MPRNPRVLLVGDFSASRVGNRSVAEDLRDRLAAAGWQVTAASRAAGALRRVLGMLAAVVRARRRVDLVSVDVYSGRAFWWAEAVTRMAKRSGLPVVTVLHGGGLLDYARRHPGRVERLLERADRRVAPSPYLAEALATSEHPIEIIPNPLDLADYPFRPRRQLSPDLAWLRSLGRLYNPQMAVRALARVHRHHPGASLTLYGPDRRDGTTEAVAHLVRRESLEPAVLIAGAVPKRQVAQHLAEHDIFLNTSRVDNAPVSVLEAMALGLPVVSTGVGGIRHLLENGRSGLLVASDDDHAMAQAVLRLVAEPDLAESLSRAARERVESLDWANVLPAWERLFAGLAGRPDDPPATASTSGVPVSRGPVSEDRASGGPVSGGR